MARHKTMDEKVPDLTTENLNQGMKNFLGHPGWGVDLHAGFYLTLSHLRKDGLTPEWWRCMVVILRRWQASRQKTDEYIFAGGKKRLPRLSREYERVCSCAKKPSIEFYQWEQVEPLFSLAMEIKKTKGNSAVFASKLCHFILPAVFPVIDNEALGFNNPSADVYQKYWKMCRQRWYECNCKRELKDILRPYVGKNAEGYPWATKIAELCAMGRKG